VEVHQILILINHTMVSKILLHSPHCQKPKMSTTQHPAITCTDFNAFGYDPDGRLACQAAVFWGPDWTPNYTVKQFVRKVKPPRYGHPALYQRVFILPGDYKLRVAKEVSNSDTSNSDTSNSNTGNSNTEFLDPPDIFDVHIFAALEYSDGGIGQ
jgi:hypothetical protein